MNLLAVGDVSGQNAVKYCQINLKNIIKQNNIDVTVINGENADLVGILPEQAEALYNSGADVITLGNHAFDKKQIIPFLDNNNWIIRPMNFYPNAAGNGYIVLTLKSGKKLTIVNLIGRLNCEWNSDSPFTCLNNLIKKNIADMYVVDFHAQATSEKAALAWNFPISAVFGTHTHVQTADERILPNGTGFITDLGMCGAEQSILGVNVEQSVDFFNGNKISKYVEGSGNIKLCGCIFEIDENTGRCVRVQRLQV